MAYQDLSWLEGRRRLGRGGELVPVLLQLDRAGKTSSLTAMAEELNRRGLRTVTGREWNRFSVRHWLTLLSWK